MAINLQGELMNSVPSTCKFYNPIKSKPTGVICEKLGVLYICANHQGNRPGCLSCEKFKQPDTMDNNPAPNEQLNEYLETLSVTHLMELSSISEATTFDENSTVRQLINKYKPANDFYLGLIALRNAILIEITKRYFGKRK